MTTTPWVIGGADTHTDAVHTPPTRCCPTATAAPNDPSIEATRSLHGARRSAVKARTATMQQIHTALRALPERHLFLGAQIKDLNSSIDDLVTTANPRFEGESWRRTRHRRACAGVVRSDGCGTGCPAAVTGAAAAAEMGRLPG